MPDSLLEQSVRDVLLQARTPTTKQVMVDGSPVSIRMPFPSPEDWRDNPIYFLMIDRFNNPNARPRNLPFDAPFLGIQGGTIEGVRQKLSYIKNLGAGAIWMTPVFQNTQFEEGSYHGYGIQNFLEIDPRFGTEQELISLIDEAHARGMYVIFDIVINHAGNVFDYDLHGSVADCQHPPSPPYDIHWRKEDGTPNPPWRVAPDNIPLSDPNLTPRAAVFPHELRENRFFRRRGKFCDELTGDFDSLKEFVTEFSVPDDPVHGFHFPVRNLLIQIYQYVIARFDVDGFRIDTLKHIEKDFSLAFGNAVREYALSIGKQNFFTFGEVIGDEEKIAEYTGRFAGDPGDLVGVDAALDFPLFFKLPGIAKGFIAPFDLVALYEHRKDVQRRGTGKGAAISSHGEASRFFTTFLDNHDGVDGNRRRIRFEDPSDPEKFDDQVTAAVACLFALQGIPVLYYGTEQGLHGFDPAGESDLFVREALWGKFPNPSQSFDQNSKFYKAIKDISAVRDGQPALRYGRQYFRQFSGSGTAFGFSRTAPGILAFARILNDMEVVVLANTDFRAEHPAFAGFAIVDFALNPDGSSLSLLYSNKGAAATPPGLITTRAKGSVTIEELGGGTNDGPCRVVPFTLLPMEVQILGRPFP
jgi:glycosidase